jgi:hypothetical protein
MEKIKLVFLSKTYMVLIVLMCVTLLYPYVTPETRFLSISAAAGITYYVDGTNGNDSNTGTSLSQAFRTIQKAASIMQAGDTAFIRGGTYRETVTPSNSGTMGNPITFRPYNNETVTVTGLDLISSSGWAVHQGNIYKKNITLALGDGNQIFVNGEMMNEARFPNKNNAANVLMGDFLTVDSATTSTVTDADLYHANDYFTGAKLMAQNTYGYIFYTKTITGFSNGTMYMDAWTTGDIPGSSSQYFVFGKLNLLDVANEYYYSNGTLYLLIDGGGNPGSQNVEVKSREYALHAGNRSFIEWNNINVKGAGIYTDSNSHYLTINGGSLKYFYHNSISAANPYTDDRGLVLNGSNHIVKNCEIAFSSASGIVSNGSSNVVLNNYIREIGYVGGYNAGVKPVSGSSNLLVAYNTFENMSRYAIHFGGGSARIRNNNIYSFGLNTKDVGAIYSYDFDANGNIEIDHNTIHNAAPEQGPVGIYIDNGSKNFLIHHNVVHSVKSPAQFNSFSINNKVYNNTFIGPGPIGTPNMETHGQPQGPNWSGNQFFNNILSTFTYGDGAYMGNNLFYDYWDLDFVQAVQGNYRLNAQSQAIDSGMDIGSITNGYTGSNPDVGAYEYGGQDWTSGHNFASPPNVGMSVNLVSFTPYYGNAFIEQGSISGSNLLVNGGFENGLTGWEDWGNASVVQSPVHSGSYALKVGPNGGGVAQAIQVSPNTVYYLDGYQSSLYFTKPNTIDVHLLDANDTIIDQFFINTGNSAYTYKGTFFKTPINCVKIKVHLTGWNNGQEFYTDQVRVIQP